MDAFHTDGGKAIIANANLDELDSEHTIWSKWGISLYEDLGDRSSALNFDEADHAIFNIPFAVPPTFDRLSGMYDDFGDAMRTMPSEEPTVLAASFDRIPYPVNGAISVAQDMQTIVNSFAVGGLDTEDEEGITDGVRLLANEIFYLGRRSDIPWLTVTPEEGFLVSREEDEAEVHFNTMDMPEGTYTGYVHVTSNDPETPVIIVECIMHIGGRVPLEMAFTEDMADITPGDEFSVFIELNDLFGLNVDHINFTVESPAPWLSPFAYEIFDGEGTLMDLTSGHVTLDVTHEDYFDGGLFARIDFAASLEAPVGGETDIHITDVTYNEDSYLTDEPEIGDPFHVSVTSSEDDWMVELEFTSRGEEDLLHFGVTDGATDGYDEGIDLLHAATGDWFEVMFMIDDEEIDGLDRDIRANGEEIVWTVETGDSAGKVEWSFRDEDTLIAMGSLFLNGDIDMKELSDYDYAAGEDLVITYRTRGDTPYTFEMKRGYNMFSLPVDPGMPVLASELFPEELGCWIFDADPDVRNWVAEDTLMPGIGYIILIPEDMDYAVWGTPVRDMVLDLQPGWNMIGTVWGNVDFSDPDDTPDGAVLGSPEHAYRYNPETLNYTRTNTLIPGGSYFVAATEEATVALPGTGSGKAAIDRNVILDLAGEKLMVGISSTETVVPVLPAVPGEYGTASAWIDGNGTKAMAAANPEGIFTVHTDIDAAFSASIPEGWNITVDGQDMPNMLKAGSHVVEIDTRAARSIDITRAYPNPFNAYLEVGFQTQGDYRLEIYSNDGRLIRTLAEGTEEGSHSVIWDGKADDGSSVASGHYLIRLSTDKEQTTEKIMLVK